MATAFTPTTLHNTARLVGTLSFLNEGPNPATIEVYEGPIGDVGGSTLLTTITLDDPAGAIVSNTLVLSASLVAFIAATGTPGWARFKNGSSVVAGDCGAGDEASDEPVKVDTAGAGQVFAGGATALFSGVFS